MKTMNNNNSIENKKNVKNVVENIAEQVTEESRKAYGEPSINEAKGWKLDHVIAFDFYHNAYIKSDKDIDKLVQMVCQECGIQQDDASTWAKDIRTMIKDYIETYDMILDEYYNTPDEANLELSTCGIGDAIRFRSEAYEPAESIMPHTFEEDKEYHTEFGTWKLLLITKQMTEAQYKAYRDSLPRTDI